MKASAIYSPEPAKGWLPWGALAPFLTIVFVALPVLGVSEVLARFPIALTAADIEVALDALTECPCAAVEVPLEVEGGAVVVEILAFRTRNER